MSKYNNRHGALRKGNGVLYAIIFLLSGLLIVSFFIITGKTSNNHTLSKSSMIKTDKKDSLSSSDKSSSAATSSSIESQSESDSETENNQGMGGAYVTDDKDYPYKIRDEILTGSKTFNLVTENGNNKAPQRIIIDFDNNNVQFQYSTSSGNIGPTGLASTKFDIKEIPTYNAKVFEKDSENIENNKVNTVISFKNTEKMGLESGQYLYLFIQYNGIGQLSAALPKFDSQGKEISEHNGMNRYSIDEWWKNN